jgi:hypothetical protein
VELRQLKPAVAVWGPHHCDVHSDVVEPDDAVHPTSLDCRLALQLQTKFDKERDSSLEVIDDDADVVHPLDRHVPEHRDAVVCQNGLYALSRERVCGWVGVEAVAAR